LNIFVFSDYTREPYSALRTNSGCDLYSDGGSMSKYTRSYDITKPNYNTSPQPFDSPRYVLFVVYYPVFVSQIR